MMAIRGTGDSIKSEFGPLRIQLRKTLSATTAVLQVLRGFRVGVGMNGPTGDSAGG